MSPGFDAARIPKALPTRLIADIPAQPDEPTWLVESLWAASGVGIIGGLPKSMKTWLAADLAVSVASGAPALGRFAVLSKGSVLLYVAEGGPRALRARFEAVAKFRGVPLSALEVREIKVPILYLDDPDHLADLRETVAQLRPRLLILDPFVRLIAHSDENSAQEVSRVLGSLRALQREFDLAVLLVHHMRKSPSPRLGQQLRGSGDFAAWYDSGLYLIKHGEDVVLHAEHRDAPAPPPLRLRLETMGGPHLAIIDDLPLQSGAQPDSLGAIGDQLLDRLRSAKRPYTTDELRSTLRVRKAAVSTALGRLRARGLVCREPRGWLIAPSAAPPRQLSFEL
jgi:hypothetical protein